MVLLYLYVLMKYKIEIFISMFEERNLLGGIIKRNLTELRTINDYYYSQKIISLIRRKGIFCGCYSEGTFTETLIN